MPITSNGFEARRFVDIRDGINQSLIDSLAIQLDTSPDTVLGVITSIFSSSITDQEELIQAIASNLDIDTAEGIYLDKLVALRKLRRLEEGFSTGTLFVKTLADGTLVQSGTLFSDDKGNTYSATSSTPINSQSATTLKLTPNTTIGTFTVTINSTQFSVVFGTADTIENIAVALNAEILLSAPTDYTVAVDGAVITVEATNKFNPLDITRNENIVFTEVEGAVSVIANTVGAVNPSMNTVTTILNNSGSFTAVTNYDTFTVGRLVETDEELRIRFNRGVSSGNPTLGSIFSTLSNIEGVSLVRIFENITDTIDSTGRPPNTYECVVEGGDTQVIGDSIYETKPAAIGTYGEITSVVTDYAGNPTTVSWSRPVLRYINVRVTYTVYDEESLPDNLANTIKAALVEYGDNLGLDTDIIPQRMYGTIYANTTGLGSITIEVGTSLNPASTTPDDLAYTTNKIAISQREKADFDAVRIQVIAG